MLITADFTLNWTTCSVIISIIALYLSIKTYKRNKKVAEKTLNKKFFDDIFSDYLLEKIPRCLTEIEKDRGLIRENSSDFNKIINEMLEEAMFYKYFENDFYKKISKIVVAIDEKTIVSPNGNSSTEVVDEYKKNLNSLVEDLYKELKDYYSKI